LANGTTKVTQEGVNGERTIVYSVTYNDGVEQSRVEKSNAITTAAIDKITSIGTYVAPAPAPAQTDNTNGATALCNDGSLSYSATHSGTCSHHGGVAVWYK